MFAKQLLQQAFKKLLVGGNVLEPIMKDVPPPFKGPAKSLLATVATTATTMAATALVAYLSRGAIKI